VNQPETNPNWNGVDDYLHQAAEKLNWPDGITYDPEQDGIELYRVPADIILIPTRIPDQRASAWLQINNYPNPFTSSTEIRYTLTNSSRVKVSIYDMNGRLIQCLANESETADEKHLLWNAENVASGFYVGYFEISDQQGRFLKTLKMQVNK